MHFGKNNACQAYTMEDVCTGQTLTLETSSEERDLGILVSNKLKWESQCIAASSKANRALGLLKNTFSYLNVDLMRKLYCCYVRPLMEFASPVWNPYFKKDIDFLERVQRRATRVPFETKGLTYHERLKLFSLQTLEERRIRGDCIQQYKIVNDIEKVNWMLENTSKSIKMDGPASAIRGHKMRLTREVTSFMPRHNFFVNRIPKAWNGLKEDTIAAQSVNIFKARLDRDLGIPST